MKPGLSGLFFARRVYRLERHAPTEPMLNEAVALIRRHQRPLIVCGGGVKYSQAEEALLRFAERCHLPIAETRAGKGALSSAHPLNVGGIGETGSLAANLLAQEADLIIGVGTRYTDFTTSSKWIFQNPDVRYLNINVSRFDVFKLDGVQMQGDARVALTQLSERLAQSIMLRNGVRLFTASARNIWRKLSASMLWNIAERASNLKLRIIWILKGV